jgi:hypothetical protein
MSFLSWMSVVGVTRGAGLGFDLEPVVVLVHVAVDAFDARAGVDSLLK